MERVVGLLWDQSMQTKGPQRKDFSTMEDALRVTSSLTMPVYRRFSLLEPWYYLCLGVANSIIIYIMYNNNIMLLVIEVNFHDSAYLVIAVTP